ncbi:MAG TPA: hypothetical protein VMM58_10550 [Bacteroidota bacterium]|nr:hypothetical protein [Bacteroidota bacterium]
MKAIFVFCIAVISVSLWGCTPVQQQKNSEDLSSLEILPHPDTLNLFVNETQALSLRGTSINSSQQTISNTGVITDAEYTVSSTDTTTRAIPSDTAAWSSSNTSAATVSQGIVIARGPGFTNITAAVGRVSAVPLLVRVASVNTAPGLSLDPPLVSLIFQDSIVVSGNVQQQAILVMTESSSHYNNTHVAYDGAGNFKVTVAGLQIGYRTIVATAQNPNQTNLATTRFKYVRYYEYLTSGADSICGDWVGTTLGRNFNFNISRNNLLQRYDINGHIDIQFEGIGLVKDITLTGIVNRDGTINASLSGTYQGFSISGSLTGYFTSSGTGEGGYAAAAKKSGWPSLSGSADWTAVKQ